jgi:hypothetical protein
MSPETALAQTTILEEANRIKEVLLEGWFVEQTGHMLSPLSKAVQRRRLSA